MGTRGALSDGSPRGAAGMAGLGREMVRVSAPLPPCLHLQALTALSEMDAPRHRRPV